MELKYFLRKKEDTLCLDSIVDCEAEKAEQKGDFHRWITEDDELILVPPAPYEAMEEYVQTIALVNKEFCNTFWQCSVVIKNKTRNTPLMHGT